MWHHQLSTQELNNIFCLIFWEGQEVWHWNFAVDRVLNKKHFYGKIMQKIKCAPKASPRPLFLVNNLKQPLHARNSFKSKIFWKRIIKKPWKSQLYFFFQTQSLQSYQNQKGPGTSVQLPFRSWNKFRKITLLVISYLMKLDDVI